MAVISKKIIIPHEENIYFQKFISKSDEEYGLRFGEPKDAEAISNIFKEVYDYKYDNPIVYDIDLLKKELLNTNNFWFVGELIKNHEIAGAGLIEKNRYIAHAGKAVVKKKFQGKGVTTKIGAAGIITVTKMPQFKDTIKLDTEVRAPEIRIQMLIQNAGALPYALIPGYANWGDRRNFKFENNTPFPPKDEEASFLYSIIFNTLWKKREKNIYLLNNEDFVFFHEYLKSHTNKMNRDVLILEKGKKNKGYELYGISKNQYEGIVNLYGTINEKSLNNLIKNYNQWRVILWRIPTTQNGIHSMALALEKGFNIVGYDLGFNNMNWTFYDSVILAYYPNGSQYALEVNCLDENKPLYNKIREIFFCRAN
ncbi:MAG: hypothetical protein ACFFD7_13070 [Candidatus Thorarchaeota archaeon]